MKDFYNELKTFAVILILIILIVICMLSKYIPITDKEFNKVEYIPNSKTILILENIDKNN